MSSTFTKSVKVMGLLVVLGVGPTGPSTGFARPTVQQQINDLDYAVNSGWVLDAAFLIFFMQTGFCMLEAGTTRPKNTKNILLKNLLTTFLALLAYWAIGYAFAFGKNAGGFIGSSYFFLYNFDDWSHFFFQFTFATTASTIASGSLAERTQFTSYVWYTIVVAAWIYPVITHWIWSDDGWLRNLGSNGFIDFAGGAVVHMTGGLIGLIGAVAVGPREGRFDYSRLSRFCKRPKVNEIPPHSSSLVALGTFILIFGWFAFNSGSTGGLTQGRTQLAGRAAVNTALAAAASSITGLVFLRILTKKYQFEETLNCALSGAVSITSACGVVEPWAAVLIGAIAAFVYRGSSELLLICRIDDPLNAVPVHFFAGMWGVISISFVATKDELSFIYGESDVYGIFFGGGGEQLGLQLLGTVCVIGWVSLWAIPMFLGLSHFNMLRVDHDTELIGLDNTKHGGSAYPYFAVAASQST